MSPAFSPAAVKTLSSLFLSPGLNILLGKDWLVMQRVFYAFIKSAQTLHDWKLPPVNVRNILILLTLQSQIRTREIPEFFLHPETPLVEKKKKSSSPVFHCVS